MERERTCVRNRSPTPSHPACCLDDRELEQCMAELDIFDDPLGEERLVRKPHFLDYDNNPPAELELVLVERRRHCHHALSIYSALPPPLEDHHHPAPRDDTSTVAATTVTVPPPAPLPMNVPSSCGTVPGTNASRRSGSPFKRGTWPLKERQQDANAPHRIHQKPPPAYEPMAGLEVGPKMECVYSLLAMLGSPNVPEMASKFLELSRNDEKCTALRRAGCVPVLVHIVHNDPNEQARRNARLALINVIRANGEGTVARRELKVLRLVDHLIDYTETLKEQQQQQHSDSGPAAVPAPRVSTGTGEQERRPIQAICTLAKISYDEDHRRAMCQFGALQTIATLIQLDHQLGHGSGSATTTEAPPSPATDPTTGNSTMYIELRRYASMVLTNLTFGQGNNKALLCANRDFMRALVAQLARPELVQVTASVLRNLSWRADAVTKKTLAEIGTVRILTEAAMRCTVENTLKSILSALWNLSNHCAHNRAHICEVDGAIEFLVGLLTYDAPSKTMAIVENAGGILRNISHQIAHSERYRQVLRNRNCLKVLLGQLKSPSLTVVSNACGTLGNLSAGSGEDQQFLRDNGAIPMLRSLIYSKHNIISNGSRLALRNLQQHQGRPTNELLVPTATISTAPAPAPASSCDSTATAATIAEGKDLPCLNVRRQRAMEQEQRECAYYHGMKKGAAAAAGAAKEEQSIGEKRALGEHDEDEEEDEEDPCGDPEPETEEEEEEEEEEQPINYGLPEVPCDLNLNQQSSSSAISYQDYQETDIDQLTDYSLRYAENQFDSDQEAKERTEEEAEMEEEANVVPIGMLIPEDDSVKCYYTEGTPQIISSATSMSDLRSAATPGKSVPTGSGAPGQPAPVPKSKPIPIAMQRAGGGGTVLVCVVATSDDTIERELATADGATAGRRCRARRVEGEDLGCNTPDKPYNYCEEGTPDFSHDASLSLALDLVAESKGTGSVSGGLTDVPSNPGDLGPAPPSTTTTTTTRTTTAIPGGVQQEQAVGGGGGGDGPDASGTVECAVATGQGGKSVSFLNTADETPLMFSRTSSMGSLSSAEPVCTDDKSSIVSEFSRLASGVISPSELPDSPTQTIAHSPRHSRCPGPPAPESAINPLQIGSVAPVVASSGATSSVPMVPVTFGDSATVVTFQVEHTPALFSCATSLSNLSIEDEQEEQPTGVPGLELSNPPITSTPAIPVTPFGCDSARKQQQECDRMASDGDSDEGGADEELLASCISIGMSSVVARKSSHPVRDHHADTDDDDSSSGGETADQSDLLLEECIRSGMPKPKPKQMATGSPMHRPGGDLRVQLLEKEHPIGIGMRPPAMPLPLPVLPNDECNRYQLEDSPCNFSTISGLSELTVGSDAADGERIVHHRRGNDSLSSLSLESDNDDHLLDEAIAAGIGSKQQNRQTGAHYHFPGASRETLPPIVSHPQVKGAEAEERLPLAPPEQPNTGNADDDDDRDSIDSIFAHDPANDSLLDQAIESGMKGACMMTELGPITGYEFQAGMLYGTHHHDGGGGGHNQQHHPDPDPPESISEPHEDDYELLTECIYAGMQRKGPVPVVRTSRPRPPAELPLAGRPTTLANERLSKNVQTTPVMSSVAGAECESSAGVVAGLLRAKPGAPPTSSIPSGIDIEREPTVRPPCSTNIPAPTHRQQQQQQQQHSQRQQQLLQPQSFAIGNSVNTAVNTSSTIINNYYSNQHCTSFISSSNSNNNGADIDTSQQQRPKLQPSTATTGIAAGTLDNRQAAEAGPGAKMTTTTTLVVRGDLLLDSCWGAACSSPAANGCDEQPATTIEKHKDPELMLQSVERLTERLVAHTEYFRTDPTVDRPIVTPTGAETDSKPMIRVPTATGKNIGNNRTGLVKPSKPSLLGTSSSIAVPAKQRSIPVPYSGRHGTVATSTSQPKLKAPAATQRSVVGPQDKPAGYRTTTVTRQQQAHGATVPSHKLKPTRVAPEAGKRRLNGASNGTLATPRPTATGTGTGTATSGLMKGSGRKSGIPSGSPALATSAPPHHTTNTTKLLFRQPPTSIPGEAGLKSGKTTVSSPSLHQKTGLRGSSTGATPAERKPGGGGAVGEKAPTKSKLGAAAAPTATAKMVTENGIQPAVKAATKAPRQRTFVCDRPTPIGNIRPHIPAVSSWTLTSKRSSSSSSSGGGGMVGQSETGGSGGGGSPPEVHQQLEPLERIPKMSLPMYGNF